MEILAPWFEVEIHNQFVTHLQSDLESSRLPLTVSCTKEMLTRAENRKALAAHARYSSSPYLATSHCNAKCEKMVRLY